MTGSLIKGMDLYNKIKAKLNLPDLKTCQQAQS
jgi:hypothetical protein